jgi:hypothetical protein
MIIRFNIKDLPDNDDLVLLVSVPYFTKDSDEKSMILIPPRLT